MNKLSHVLTFCAACVVIPLAMTAQGNPDGSILMERMPDQWIYEGAVTEVLPDDSDWWKSFDDPTLDSLVNLAVQRNLNLSQAAHRREMARLAVKSAQSAYYPTIGASAGYARSRAHRTDANEFSLGAQMNWEIDVFGKINSQVKAKKSALNVSKSEYRGSLISLIADVATYYTNYRVLQAELQVAREHLESQARVLHITEARHEAGLVSKLDVAQAKVVYGNTSVTIPQLEAQMQQTFNAMAILLGEYPEQLAANFDYSRKLPATIERIVPAGVPADLLRRRPDIAQAEATLAGYAAQVGIAKKDFLPSLSLAGTVGLSSGKIDKLFEGDNLTYSIGPTLSWTIFEGMGRKYALAQAKEQMEAGIEDYNLTVMNAVEEVNSALANYHSALATVGLERGILEDSHEAFTLSMDQYKQGLAAFTNVMNAQIDWLNCANSLATAHGNAMVALIDLYKALGGSPTE